MNGQVQTLSRQYTEFERFGSFFFVIHVKGIKHLTKTRVDWEVEGVAGAVRRSVGKLHREMGYLDQGTMEDDATGEVYYDLGINITPTNSLQAVGLLKLDRLEESYMASGYLKGKRHNLNTLDHYGGLQAEMRQEHQQQGWVSGGASYPLIYQTVRRADNEVKSFRVSDVALRSDKYESDYENLERVLREEAGSMISYGVRREIRLGTRALRTITDEDGGDSVLVSLGGVEAQGRVLMKCVAS